MYTDFFTQQKKQKKQKRSGLKGIKYSSGFRSRPFETSVGNENKGIETNNPSRGSFELEQEMTPNTAKVVYAEKGQYVISPWVRFFEL